MAAPLDRIRQALGPEQAAKFDRALALLADLVDDVKATKANARPEFVPRFHQGELLDVDVVRRVTVS